MEQGDSSVESLNEHRIEDRDRVVESLEQSRAELDRLGYYIAAAHVDMAINSLASIKAE
jgi:hypothetical protein